MRIGIGIDTGGTYTDAVVYNFEEKKILGTAKSLTTKEDLSVGILGALDALPRELLKEAEVVSLSTTLATNACVEDKGGRAKLAFFGGDPKIIEEFGAKFGLPPVEEIHVQESYTGFYGEIKGEPDWDFFAESVREKFKYLDGAGIIELHAMKNGAVVEKKAREILKSIYDIPVVCGHELFSEPSGLKRGASTLLNAQLFPVIEEFLDAMKTAMKQRGMDATIVIVRSDGSLMSEEFARLRPVETLLCGPAASVMGGTNLTNSKNTVIVDMGGTTTDIALVTDGSPVKAKNGVAIGKWKTFVDGIYLKTFGLGGDTAIHYNDDKVFLEDYRIIPLCVAADKYPNMIENLRNLVENVSKHTRFLHEHYMLIKDISKEERYTQEEKAFCDVLKQGPVMIREAAEAVGKDIYTLNVSRLLKEGVVQLCGLTPTDIMHIKGDFDRYDKEASYLGAQFVASNFGMTVEELCDFVYDEIKRKIYVNVVAALLENQYPDYMENGINADVERFINENYEMSKNSADRDMLSMMFHTDYVLVGIGAPIHIFLSDVAKKMGTESVIPEHSEVANAVGAVVGNVSVTYEVEIRPSNSLEGISGYTVYTDGEPMEFEELYEAEEFAKEAAEKGAYEEAQRRGVQGNITVECQNAQQSGKIRGGTIYLGSRLIAHAVGSIGF